MTLTSSKTRAVVLLHNNRYPGWAVQWQGSEPVMWRASLQVAAAQSWQYIPAYQSTLQLAAAMRPCSIWLGCQSGLLGLRAAAQIARPDLQGCKLGCVQGM